MRRQGAHHHPLLDLCSFIGRLKVFVLDGLPGLLQLLRSVSSPWHLQFCTLCPRHAQSVSRQHGCA